MESTNGNVADGWNRGENLVLPPSPTIIEESSSPFEK